jgi:excisionase family DNA binding protein
MAQGKAVTVAPHNLQLTTQEAADLLGISRPTLVRLLERGDIPLTKPNRHPRVQLIDVLAYQQRVPVPGVGDGELVLLGLPRPACTGRCGARPSSRSWLRPQAEQKEEDAEGTGCSVSHGPGTGLAGSCLTRPLDAGRSGG